MQIYSASHQWSTRPEDERFPTLQSLLDATKAYYQSAIEREATISDLRTEEVNGDVQLVGRQNAPAKLTHWSFGQLASKVGAPAEYLRNIPATLACQNLNWGLKNLAEKSETASLLLHNNGSLLLRAITSQKYVRIWNWEVAERLLGMQEYGWVPAESDFNMAKDSDLARERDLYASDHDMFVFLCNGESRVAEPGNPEGLKRGIIVENSEVGSSALKMTKFLYRGRCGNHICWGVSKMMEISVRHVGDARNKWSQYQYELKKYAESSVHEDEARISSAKTRIIADTKEQVLDRFGQRNLNLSLKTLTAGYDATKPEEDGDPRSVWGVVNGLTRFSQSLPYADQRIQIDRAAGKLMEGSF
jgi:hypothetical protein